MNIQPAAWLGTLLCSLVSAKADDIAFFYALDRDLQTLKAEAEPAGPSLKIGSRTIQRLTLGVHQIYAVKMGSGVLETAMSAQALLARVHCDAAFSVGPVGGLADRLRLGLWYSTGDIISYQKGSWTKDGFQMSSAARINCLHLEVNTNCLPELFRNAPQITIASGEIFVASTDYRVQLHDATKADAVDMNLAGLAGVCADHHVPMAGWRVVSDHADDFASIDFQKFAAKYDGAGGKAVAGIIKTLPPSPNLPTSYPRLKALLAPP